jgi:hypothetical protein
MAEKELLMKKYFPVVIAVLALATGCTHYYYVPNIHNIPMFREKNEARISGSYGGGDESNGFELQGSWAVTNHIGLSSSFITSRSPQMQNDEDWAKGSYIDLAAGYYIPFNKYGVFEVYGGFGGCSQTHNYGLYDYNSGSGSLYGTGSGKAYLKSRRLFIQPAVGFEFKIIEFAFSARICRLSFNDVNFNLDRETNEYDFDKLTEIQNEKVYYFIEPALTLRAGWKNVKIQAQYSIGSYQFWNQYYFEPFHFGLGIQVAFGERFRKESEGDGVK